MQCRKLTGARFIKPEDGAMHDIRQPLVLPRRIEPEVHHEVELAVLIGVSTPRQATGRARAKSGLRATALW